MKERYQTKVAVFLILTRNNNTEILLQKRYNTGYMDNLYDMSCSGHLEHGESLSEATVREAKEELGININEKNLKLVSVIHAYNDDYLNIFFETNIYEGVPEIKEPDKCSDLHWFNIDNLPEDTIPRIKNVLKNLKIGINYDDYNFSHQKFKTET